MSAGLPGLGLGGMFFIISALLAPFIELARMAVGRRREVAWRDVWRQFAMAVTMIVAVDLSLRSLYAVGALLNIGDPPSVAVVTVIPLVPVAITGCLLAAVLLAAKAVDLATPVLRDLPPLSAALPSRRRVLAAGGIIATVWFALLLVGAADLSTLSGRGDGAANAEGPKAPPEDAEPMVAAQAPGDTKAGAGSGAGAEGDGPGPSGGGGAAHDGGVAPDAAPDNGGEGGGQPTPAGSGAAPAPGVPAPNAPEAGGQGGGGGAPQAPGPAPAPGAPPQPEPPAAGPPPAPEPPENAGPPDSAGPPGGGGPPEAAGPPAHSNAPPHAGPG